MARWLDNAKVRAVRNTVPRGSRNKWRRTMKLQRRQKSLPLRVLLPSVRCSFFDQGCNLLRPGDVDRVAGAGDFDLVAVGSRGIPPFAGRVDGSVRCGYQHPARFASPRSRGDDSLKIVSE